MAKSDARFGYRADLKRTDHDLSQTIGFTSASGMLLPIWYDFASPGDSYYMNHLLPLLRSANLAAPAMVDVKVHFETFFVPIQMIYQPFENTYFRIKPILSSTFGTNDVGKGAFPLFDYSAYVTTILGTSQIQTDTHVDAFRLADLFGLCPDCFTSSSATYQDKYAPSFFPWQICAYNTIYQYYYRLDDKESFSNLNCNIDRYYSSDTFTMSPDFLKIYQRPWDFDYYKSMYRSPIISNANVASLGFAGSKVDLFEGYSSDYGNVVAPQSVNGTLATENKGIRDIGTDAYFLTGTDNRTRGGWIDLSTAAIRQMFAYEKLLMVTGRTRKNYDSQVLAHFGFKVPHDVKHDITMIHHDEFELKVQEVTSLASTSQAPLGDLAGKSYSSGKGERFKFTAPCHGVLMTIFSVEPKMRYIGGFDRLNAVQAKVDLPIQEYDRLGNVPMFRYEVGVNLNDTIQSSFTLTDIIGWKERYYPFKRKHDKATIAFDRLGLGDNVCSAYMLASRPFANNSTLDPSAVHQRPDLQDRFYIPRDAVDQLCLVPFEFGWYHSDIAGVTNWDDAPWMVYARDPFIIDSRIACKKVSWMSKDGEPVYDF